jgi:anti-sigma regulatory factor (Ser/Thr protein kinase)
MKDLAMHVMDIAQNSIRAGAMLVHVTLDEQPENDVFIVRVEDDGKGMNEDMIPKVLDPFFTTRETRKVGLGIPLLKQNAEQAGGKLQLRSTPGKGTRVEATFQYHHLDRPTTGDIAGTMALLIFANPGMDFVYKHVYNDHGWQLDTREIREILGEMPLDSMKVRKFIKEMIEENLEELKSDQNN